MGAGAAGADQHLEDVVERGGVRAARLDHRLDVARRCSPKAWAAMRISWLFIQLTLPFSVLISPLWASIRNGWASRHSGKVLVE